MSEDEIQQAFDTICPVCDRRYGLHADEEMRVCFPALVALGGEHGCVNCGQTLECVNCGRTYGS